LWAGVDAILAGDRTVAEVTALAQEEVEARIAESAINEAEANPAPNIRVAGSDEEPVVVGGSTIIFTTGIGTLDLQSYRALAETFHKTHPDITIEFNAPNFDGRILPSLRNMAMDADCFQGVASLLDKEELDAILSINPFLEADPTISKEDFFPSTIDQLSYEGQLWGLPGEVNISLMIYNKALFDAAEVTYPTLEWTTDDFLTLAITLTKGEDEATKQYGFVPSAFEMNDLITFLNQLGVWIIDDGLNPPIINLADPSVVDGMRWYADLTVKYRVKPVFETSLNFDDMGDFERRQSLIEYGHAAMWIDDAISFAGSSMTDLNLGVVPLPASPDGRNSGGYQFASGYFISAQAKAPQACWEWIKFLTEQATLNVHSSALPARIAVAESTAYKQAVGEEYAIASLASIANMTQESLFPRVIGENSWMQVAVLWLVTAYEQVLNEGISVEEALTNAQANASAYQDCLSLREGFGNPQLEQACLQEVDDSLAVFLFGMN
jgi:multiple sugar transport system substrate-binding protein